MTESLGGVRILAAIVMATAAATAAAGATVPEHSAVAEPSPVGVWTVQVTLRDCTTNAPLGAPFNSLVTIHDGGTVSESAASPAFAIGQRSAGHGTWDRQGGHTYLQKMISLIGFDTAPNLPGTPGFNPALPVSPGFFTGWSIVTHEITMVDADNMTSGGTNAFYRADGTVYRRGCSTAVGQRLQ